MDAISLLKTLTETAGASGHEQAVARVVQDLWSPLVDEIRRDRVGSLVALKRGRAAPIETAADSEAQRPRLLLACHMDEIALMVKDLVGYPDPAGAPDATGVHGFLRVTDLGGVDRRHLHGQRVVVHGREPLPGVIGGPARARQGVGRRNKPYDYDELVVDVGRSLALLRELVSVGDVVTFHQPLRKLLNGQLAGKALDNRASVAAVTLALESLQEREHYWDVLAVATVQEETGLLGAYVSGFAERPAAAIAVDVTHGLGPGSKGSGNFELGSGPVLDVGPNVHPGLFAALEETAEALEMSVSRGWHTRGSGTDAHGLQVARAGVPTAVVSIPLRYMHTMVETVAVKDVTRAGRLLGEFAARLRPDFEREMARGMMAE